LTGTFTSIPDRGAFPITTAAFWTIASAGVSLEPFIQVNYNAYLHAKDHFGGKPQRLRHILSDFHGGIAELLAKAVSQNKLDEPVTVEDKELLLGALRQWGALDRDYAYKAGPLTSDRRGYQQDPGGGLSGEAVPSEPLPFAEILHSRVWSRLAIGQIYEFQSTIFQPVGGMDIIAKAFEREVGRLDARVIGDDPECLASSAPRRHSHRFRHRGRARARPSARVRSWLPLSPGLLHDWDSSTTAPLTKSGSLRENAGGSTVHRYGSLRWRLLGVDPAPKPVLCSA
jgi:hypothetical protein